MLMLRIACRQHAKSLLGKHRGLESLPNPRYYGLKSQGRSQESQDAASKSWISASALASLLVLASSSTALESLPSKDEDQRQDQEHETAEVDEEVEIDPYANLPEKDEPTHCSICKTYRQGPCRPFWRKVEACTKDHGGKDENEDGSGEKKSPEENGAEDADDIDDEDRKDPPCMKYILPFVECATGFRNMYNLIELDTNYTLGIADLEKDADVSLCWSKSHQPVVDWGEWDAYLNDNPVASNSNGNSPNVDVADSGGGQAVSTTIPLWKALDADKEPTVISVDAHVSMAEPDSVGQLECAYALDQNGQVIGFVYGEKIGEGGKKLALEEVPYVTLKIRILPGITKSFTLGASYLRPNEDSDKSDGDESKNDDTSGDGNEKKPSKVISHLYKSSSNVVPIKKENPVVESSDRS